MDFFLTLVLSLMFGIMAAALWVLAGFVVTALIFGLGDLGIGLTEGGAIVVGIVVFILSFRKMWSVRSGTQI